MFRHSLSILSLLILSTVTGPALGVTQPPHQNKSSATHIVQAGSKDAMATYAQDITVRVSTNSNQGSGTLLAKQNNTYLVLTNAHLLRGARAIQIQTHDGQTHTATPVNNSFAPGYDLALVTFVSNQSYQLPEVGNFTPRPGQSIVSAGYAADTKQFQISTNQLKQILDQPLKGGYQLGYQGDVKQGMSGGPVIETQTGELVGINGRSAFPVVYDYETIEGKSPSPETVQQLRQNNWGIPLQTVLAQIQPQTLIAYGLPAPKTGITLTKPNWTGWLAELENKARQFTVRIDNKTEKTNGSGVIIAKRGNTYTVLTAEHVLRQEPDTQSSFTLTTADGQDHPLPPSRFRREPGVDLAVVEFESAANYAVASLANYRQSKDDAVFVAGFPQIGQIAPQWLMSGGGIFEQEQGRFNITNTQITSHNQGGTLSALAATQASFAQGYDLVYTSITYGGMSGGPVLDYQGRVLGIHGQAEAEESATGNSVIQLGNSLGIPINTFLGLASRLQVNPQQMDMATTSPPPLSQQQVTDWRQALLSVAVPTQNAAPDVWIQRGNQLSRLGRYSEAIAAFERAIQLNRDYMHLAYFGKAEAFRRQEKFQQAITALQESIRRQPDYTPAWEVSAINYRLLQQDEEALATINQALQLQSQNANLYNEKYLILSNLGRHQEALATINKALTLSKRATFYSNRGTIYGSLQKYSQAIADFNKAIDLNPEFALAYNNRGNTYNLLEKYPQAIKDLNKAIDLNPEFAGAYSNRGNTYNALQKYSQAIADFNKAIDLNPKFAEAYTSRGNTYNLLEKYSQAIKDLDKAIDLNPKLALAYNNRGNAYNALQKSSQALANYDKAIDLNPKLALAYSNRGGIHTIEGNITQAIKDLDKAIDLNPKLALAYNNRGNAYNALQKYSQAIADFNKAIDLNPKFAEAYTSRGNTYNALQKYPQALADYDKAINLNPKLAKAYSNRGNTYNLW